MLKVLAAVLAVLSAAISITIYTATLPDVQKQSADNAAAIETLNNEVNSIPTQKKYYNHNINVSGIKINIINSNSTAFNNSALIEYINTYGDIYINKSTVDTSTQTLRVNSYITATSSTLKVVGYSVKLGYSGNYFLDINQTEGSVFSSISDTVTEL